MKVIGLCGGSGSGKGTVAGLFSAYGVPSIDTDALYHKMTSEKSPCLDALVNEFGTDILNGDGSLNRKALSEIVFSADDSEGKRAVLNKISHAFVLEETIRIMDSFRSEGVQFVLVDVPLMFESGFDKLCDIIIAVTADVEVRVKRIVFRDSITESGARRRIDSQLSDEYLIKNSNYHIINNGNLDELSKAVSLIAEKILNTKEK